MRRSIRLVSFSLAALLAAAALAGCNSEKAASSDTTANNTTVPVTTEAPVPKLSIIADSVSSFTIVRPETSDTAVTQAAISLRKAIEDKFGCSLTITTDWVKNEADIPTDTFEILVGTTNRAESTAALAELKEGEFIIQAASDKRIVLLGANDNATIAAVNTFLSLYIDEAEGKSFSLAADTRFTGAIYDSYAEVREVKSNLQNTPSMVTNISTKAQLDALSQNSPATAILTFKDGKLALDQEISLGDALASIFPHTIPAFRVESLADAQTLMKQTAAYSLNDYFILSSQPEIITYAVEQDSKARGILDYSALSARNMTDADLYAIRAAANTCYARVVLLPEWMADTETVEYLRKLLVTVWLSGGEQDTDTELVQMITSGAHGIVTADTAALEACFTKYFGENTIARRTFVIGHRGIPSLAPENTIESSLLAYEKGADVIENDIYLSKDGKIVVMHDSSIDRTTNGTGKIEEMTLEQIKSYYVNKQFGNKYPDCKIPTLKEYFEAFKDTDAHIFIEIKSKKTEIIQKMYDLIKAYDMADQVTIIAFGTDIMRECKKVCPELSLGYLVSNYSDAKDAAGSLVKVNELTGDYHTTFNPNYASISQEFLTAALHRGITVWPWTLNDGDSFFTYFLSGASGVTTNYANYSGSVIRSLRTDSRTYTAKVGEAVTPALTATRYDRTEETLDTAKLEIIFIEGENLAKVDGATVTPTEAGQITFIYSYSAKTMMRDEYRVVTQPITITAAQ